MSPTVGIIGCGIVGPVIATLLKQSGFDPILFERNDGVATSGIGSRYSSSPPAVILH